jgi:hypothetical protein
MAWYEDPTMFVVVVAALIGFTIIMYKLIEWAM